MPTHNSNPPQYAVKHLLPALEDAKVLIDRDTCRARKAGFFTFATESQAWDCTRMRSLKISGRNRIVMHVAEGSFPRGKLDFDIKSRCDGDGPLATPYGTQMRRVPGRKSNGVAPHKTPFHRRNENCGGHNDWQQPSVEYQQYFWSQAQIAYQMHVEQCIQAYHFAMSQQHRMSVGFRDMACQQQLGGLNQVQGAPWPL